MPSKKKNSKSGQFQLHLPFKKLKPIPSSGQGTAVISFNAHLAKKEVLRKEQDKVKKVKKIICYAESLDW